MITNFTVDNFKSLKGVNVNLSPINFIAGPNASGKSNFTEALDFISHALRENLQYAVADKGGFYNICHRRQRRARGAISFTIKAQVNVRRHIECFFSLSFSLRASGEDIRADFFVESESLHADFVASPETSNPQHFEIDIARAQDQNGKPIYKLANRQGQEELDRLGDPLKSLRSDLRIFDTVFPKGIILPEKQNLLLAGAFKGIPPLNYLVNELLGIRVFQLSPRIARQPAAPSIHGELGRRGENLASAIDQMRLTDAKGFSTLADWIREVVPSLTGVLANYTETKQLGLFFEEKGVGAKWYAEDISDGTIMSLALFFALLAKDYRIVVIEEPENTLHPWILRRFLDRCREQMRSRQIIITTHSPLVVAQAKPDELFLAERDSGISSLRRAIDIEKNLDKIIKKELLDLGEYWLSGSLGAVPKSPDLDERDLFGDKQK